MYKILIVDDEPAIRTSLAFALEDNYMVFTAGSEQEALKIIAANEINIVLLDLKLGTCDGIEVLGKIKNADERIIVIIMTAYGSIKSSVDAMKEGAFYYITKPLNIEELQMLLGNATEYIGLKFKVQYLNEKLTESYEVSGMIGKSSAMKDIFQQIDKLKSVDSNVLIIGESGTGKELVAKALHYCGIRKNEPFEVINCAAIPADLLESELFGYEKGAFTGALQKKRGVFELANKGTLFLDEIGEMDLRLQAKLLRVVQEKEITPLGSTKRGKIDVRIVSATNRNLKDLVKEGKFREDLYFRLNVITVNLPPLRERKSDIPLLVDCFINKYSNKMGKNIKKMSPKVLELLSSYTFKGNIRELENIIERCIVFAEQNIITAEDLPIEIQNMGNKEFFNSNEINNYLTIPISIGEDLKSIEQKVITQTLKHFKGDKQKTANVLKISERKLWYKIKEYEIILHTSKKTLENN